MGPFPFGADDRQARCLLTFSLIILTEERCEPQKASFLGSVFVMDSLRRSLPPPNSLVYFEAAARQGSFSRAADELRVSQAAVSRQIRLLEDHLGVRLFTRQHRAVLLTAQGKTFYEAVAMGLRYIASSATEVQGSLKESTITVGSTVAVSALWLRPRIAEFLAMRPALDIRLVASDKDIDLQTENIDICIRYGDGRWAEGTARFLFEEEIFPVCSPDYLRTRPAIDAPADLLDHMLLHFDRQYPDWINWDVWLQEQGVDATATRHGLKFNNYPILIQAAIDGQGIALGWGRLIEHLLARGVLVRPIEAMLRSTRAYYLVTPVGKPVRPEAEALSRWLLLRASQPEAS